VDPTRQQGQTGGVFDETRTERTADLPNIINVQLERHRLITGRIRMANAERLHPQSGTPEKSDWS